MEKKTFKTQGLLKKKKKGSANRLLSISFTKSPEILVLTKSINGFQGT